MYDHYLEKYIARHLDHQDDEYYKFGYRAFGPYLFGLSTWLYQDLRKNNLNRILFLARDGYMVKKAFDLLFSDNDKYQEKIKSSYIYASRRSFAVPTLVNCQSPKELFEKYPYLKTSFGKALKKLGLTNKDLDGLPEPLLNIVFNDSEELLKHQEARGVLEALFPKIVQNSRQEATLLQAYFKQEAIQGDVALFDIGWHGTLQKALFELKAELSIKSVTGYYTGILPKKSESGLTQSKGYLFDTHHGQAYYKFMGLSFPIFERLFQPQEGSCIGFKKKEDRIVPLLEEFLHDVGSPDQRNLLAIQAGALAFVENFASDLPEDNPYWDKKDAIFWFSGFEAVIKTPSLAEAKALGSLTLENEGELYSLAAPKNVFAYLLRPKDLMRDFNKSWKVAFLKRLVKLPLPYHELLKKYYKLDV